MFEVDLRSQDRYPPLAALSTAELFALGCALARTMPGLRVRAPVSDDEDAAVTLDGKLLSRKGVEVF
ncbi:MAG: hypothetical protein ACM33T_08070 [Solirubrobacterales bacterium]